VQHSAKQLPQSGRRLCRSLAGVMPEGCSDVMSMGSPKVVSGGCGGEGNC
jgi:hypothetical protein